MVSPIIRGPSLKLRSIGERTTRPAPPQRSRCNAIPTPVCGRRSPPRYATIFDEVARAMDFVKMHGTGNDFVVVDGRDRDAGWPALARSMCDRHFGVGADARLVVAPPQVAPLRMRMFNPDGSEAEMCGNGIRCFVKYAVESGLAEAGATLAVETGAGVLDTEHWLRDGHVGRVRLSMGTPRFAARE